jgi:hypothetical protein
MATIRFENDWKYGLQIRVASIFRCTYSLLCFFLKYSYQQQDPNPKYLQEIDEEGKIILNLEIILKTRIKKLRNQAIIEYLIKWKNLLVEEATWEDELFVQKNPWLVKC